LSPKQELYTTLHHELTQMAVSIMLRGDFERLPKAWHEFISYAVQLDLMPIELSSNIQERYEENPHFDVMPQINRMIFALADPDWLAVTSYNTYIDLGGPGFLRKILRGEVDVTPIYGSVTFT
jgi:hypothetical protein